MISLVLIAYAYLGYPIVLLMIAGRRLQEKTAAQNGLPSVAIVFSIFNEEKDIGSKLENIDHLDYPKDKVEIVVVSDGSTDSTEKIIRSKAISNLQLLIQQTRQGKSVALNRAVAACSADILVFTDANSFFDKEALKYLTAPFADPKVGCVSGRTLYRLTSGGVASVGVYSKLEHFVKRYESRLGSCIGADGAIFALRRNMFETLDPSAINDFVVPTKTTLQGYRGIFEPLAFCIESAAGNIRKEFNRQSRITTRTLNALFHYLPLLIKKKRWMFLFQLISHKMAKFVTPCAMLTLLISTIISPTTLFLRLLLLLQVLFYSLAVVGLLSKRLRRFRSISLPLDFTVVNSAILLGWIHYLAGRKDTIWEPQRELHE